MLPIRAIKNQYPPVTGRMLVAAPNTSPELFDDGPPELLAAEAGEDAVTGVVLFVGC